ncbi:MAG: hypothetical protein ACK5KO_03450 [Arachnia sp.]
MTTSTADDLLRQVSVNATDVDSDELPATWALPGLAERGLLDLGIAELLAEGTRDDVRDEARLIAAIAQECVASAFSLWAHRMVLDYLARGERSARTAELLTDLRAARRIGSTAMAAGLKTLAGIGEVELRAQRCADGWSLTGPIAWASNLVPGSVFVAPARTETGQVIVAWIHTDTEGVHVFPARGLLALDATASGGLKLDQVRVADDQVIANDLVSLAAGFKPAFLVLQSSFCAGLITRSLHEAEASLDRGDNTVLASDVAHARASVEEFLQQWQRLAADLAAASRRELLQLRLDASALAIRVTRLESTLAGGRGYATKSPASRRFREAAFLPVQSPSEGHLRWELASLPH